MVRTRPTWNEQFLEIAYVVAKRATCLRRGFGAVIVNPKTHQIISTGYCGNASGIKDCIDLGKCYRDMIGAPSGVLYDLCNSIHAEENAIMQAGKERCLGNVIYVTGIDFTEENNLFYGKPCYKCESKIITAGLEEIIFFNKNCKKIKDIKEENIMKLKVADVIIGRKNNPFENQEKQVTILKEKGLQFKESQ